MYQEDKPWQTSTRKKQAQEKKELEPVIDYDPGLENEKARVLARIRGEKK